jgi:RNA polymerase sigma-70 factor, ECF subfamily
VTADPTLEDHPAAGDPGPAPSFDRIFQEHAPFVWRALRRLGVGDADADDACQDVFVVVHRKLGTLYAGSPVRTWLYGICLRVASDHRRRPHRRREDVVESVPEESVPPDQDEILERRRAIARLDAALDQLDHDKRAVFVLFELERVPMAEVAELCGCPLQTAYSRLYAARRSVEATLRPSLHVDPQEPGARARTTPERSSS